ncbi:MAG: peptidase S10, partial [Chlamydiae bacterium]|nr:peptidase S10 [Chlamydiota bacterium]
MKNWIYPLLLCQCMTWGFSDEPSTNPSSQSTSCLQNKDDKVDDFVETRHKLNLQGSTLSYTAKAGTLTIKDNCQKPKAKVFYVAYTKDDVADKTQRPVTFCFNGGPGSSSVWLHLGAFGPKRVLCDDAGIPSFPFQLVDNTYTLLDSTDLVFVDPVATGYSKPVEGEDAKQFFGLENDANYLCEFIRLYTTKNDRWMSPKILMGESYGTTRVSALAYNLQDEHLMFLDGVVLISSVLNWQTIQSRMKYIGNDLACVLSLPSFAASSYYFKKVNTSKSFSDFLKEVESFALTEYNQALMKGDQLTSEERKNIIKKMASYTGLSEECISLNDMRIVTRVYTKEVLQSEGLVAGRFDARVTGWDLDPSSSYATYDPS